MNIDTTATNLQVSQPPATRADVAGLLAAIQQMLGTADGQKPTGPATSFLQVLAGLLNPKLPDSPGDVGQTTPAVPISDPVPVHPRLEPGQLDRPVADAIFAMLGLQQAQAQGSTAPVGAKSPADLIAAAKEKFERDSKEGPAEIEVTPQTSPFIPNPLLFPMNQLPADFKAGHPKLAEALPLLTSPGTAQQKSTMPAASVALPTANGPLTEHLPTNPIEGTIAGSLADPAIETAKTPNPAVGELAQPAEQPPVQDASSAVPAMNPAQSALVKPFESNDSQKHWGWDMPPSAPGGNETNEESKPAAATASHSSLAASHLAESTFASTSEKNAITQGFTQVLSQIDTQVVAAESQASTNAGLPNDKTERNHEKAQVVDVTAAGVGESALVSQISSSQSLQAVSDPVPLQSLSHRVEQMVMHRLDNPGSNHDSVVLRLDPPELGRVNVHVSVANDIVSIRLVASDEGAKQVIERQLSDLQQSLSDQGVALNSCQVDCDAGGRQSFDRSPYHQMLQDDSVPATIRRHSAFPARSLQPVSTTLLNYVA